MTSSRILVVEDEAIVAMNIEGWLRGLGYGLAGKARSGEQALKLIREQRPDLILMDIRLKGPMDGIAVAAAVRRDFHIPVIFLTAHADDETLERAKLTEPYGYLLKPFDDRALKTAIEIALYKHYKDSEARFRHIVETANEGIWALDEAHRTTYVNQVMADLLGYTPQEMLGKLVAEFMYPEELADHQEKMARRRQGLDDRYERRFQRKDGSELWAIVSVRALRDDQGVFQGSFAMLTDITERRRAEEWLRTVLRTTRDGYLLVNAAGQILDANDSYGRMTGYSREEILQMTIYDLEAQLSFEEIQRELQILAANGGGLFETKHRARDGRIIDFEVSLTFLPRDGGRFVAFLRDITERRKMEQSLRDNEQFLTDIFDNIQDGLSVLDTDLNIIRVNPAMERVAHTEPVVGRKCYEVYQFRREPCEQCPVRETIRTGRATQHIITIPAADGSVVYAEIHAFPLFDNRTGQLQGVIEYVRDITERKKAEEYLRRSEKRHRDLVETSFDWIWEIDAQGRYTYASPKVKEILGYPPEEVVGRTPFDFMSTLEAQRMREFFGRIVAEKRPFASLENVCRHRQGRQVILETSGVPWFDAQGEFLGYRGSDRDITERREAEKTRKKLEGQFYQAQKMEAVGTLAGGIAHDFNNILMAILGYTEMARNACSIDKKAKGYLDQVLQASQRAKELVRQILTFCRRADSEKKPLQIGPIIKETLKLLRAGLPATIEIRSEITGQNLILADATQIHQVIMNLATNAFQAISKTGGQMEVRVTDVVLSTPLLSSHGELPAGPYVRLEVQDDGKGMEPAVRERIFEPYFTTKESGEGTGLGLATVLGIVKDHGGDILVESEPGRGTTFTLYFPALDQDCPDDPAEAMKTWLGGVGRILFIDDEPALAEFGREALTGLGYEVVMTTNSLEAVEVFASAPEKFDLVITDLTMPKLSGSDLAKIFLEIRPDLPIIVCSGHGDENKKQESLALGIREFLVKPLGVSGLAEIVQKILAPNS